MSLSLYLSFPPTLWIDLAEMWNRGSSPYLICYHPPKDIVDGYGFHVELVAQTPTSMHGSKEGHTGYIYRRHPALEEEERRATCDPAFNDAHALVKSGLPSLRGKVAEIVSEKMDSKSGPVTRASRRSF